MNLKKYTKKQLGEIITNLEEHNAVFISRNKNLRAVIETDKDEHNEYITDLQALIAELSSKLEEVEKTNQELVETINKRRRSTKRRLTRLKNAEEKQAATIKSLFSMYSTILLENNWNDRIDWKNDLLEEIEQAIQYLSR